MHFGNTCRLHRLTKPMAENETILFMKKLKLDLKGLGTQLTKIQMKQVMGGYDGGACLYCRTSGGDECWYKSSVGDAWTECNRIYPGIQTASAHWGDCTGGCHMN